VLARAAAINGNHAEAAELLAKLAGMKPDQTDLAEKALGEALGAGKIELAISLARSIPPAKLASDARLLLVADEIRHDRDDFAVRWLTTKADNGDLRFLVPLVNAWSAADHGDAAAAMQAIGSVPDNSLLAPLKDEQRAFLLLKFKRTAEAEPFARRAIGTSGQREERVRLALADGFLAAGDKARAAIMLDGMGSDGAPAEARLAAGKPNGEAIDSLGKALSESIVYFAGDIARLHRGPAPLGLVQVARYADPGNASATSLLALLLHAQERTPEALAVLATVPVNDALIDQVRDAQVQILVDDKRFDEAYRIAAAAASAPGATAGDYSRLGEVYAAMKRSSEAADAYGKAIAMSKAAATNFEQWTLLLLRASALEDAGRWPEARQALEAGLAIAPDQPLLLNFLGYAKLERGEDMDKAEAMIRKASELAPDDASIIDSLGWAQFKRGKVDAAIDTLQQAAAKDPEQAEIQEHLGDALYSSGRRYEARYAWRAALITAEDDIAGRIKAKLASGLSAGNAAP
jgi:tetratricopeptide (TPR) repeat protein